MEKICVLSEKIKSSLAHADEEENLFAFNAINLSAPRSLPKPS
jgi:hypothetical protein